MRDVLLDCFTGYLEYKAITANGEITVANVQQHQIIIGLVKSGYPGHAVTSQRDVIPGIL